MPNRFGDSPVNRFGDRPAAGVSATSQVFGQVGPSVAQGRFDEAQTEQARIEQQLGAPFSRTGEFGDFFGRMGLATQEGEAEKALRLQEKNPDFDVRTIQTNEGKDPLTVFRKPGEDAFSAIDRPGGSMTSDIADIIGSLGNLENLASLVGAVVAPQSLPLRAGAMGLAGLLGNEADAQIEKAQGFELATPQERNAERTFAGGSAAGGEALGSLLVGGKQLAKGERGLVKPNPRSAEAIRIVNENPELTNLSAGQVSPIFKRKENQAATTGNALADFREGQQSNLADSIRNLAPPAESGDRIFSDESLLEINRQSQQDILNSLGEQPGSEAAVRQAGSDLQTARSNLVETKRAEKDALYERAFESATPDIEFDITNAKREAAEALRGVVGKGPKTKTQEPDQILSILDEFVNPIVKKGEESIQEGVNIRIAEKFSGPMRSGLRDLAELDTVLKSDQPREAFEQIKALRTQFFDLKQPNPQTGQFTNEQRIASRIYNQLTEALKNPKGGADDFTQALGAANKANVEFDQLVNTKTMKDIAKSENPQQLFGQIVSSGNFEQLALLEKELTPQEFRKLGKGFDEFLRLDPKNINKILDGFARDKDSLRKLLPEVREKQLRIVGNAVERSTSAPAVKVLKSTGDAGARALKIMEGGTEEQFQSFVKSAVKANATDEADTKKALLHGVVTNILDKNKTIKDGRVKYNMNKIANEMQTLIESGRMKQIADPKILRALKDRSFIASVLGASDADVGASLAGASVASEAVSVNPKEAIGGFLGVAHNEIWARILTHPKTVTLLAGSGKTSNKAVDKGIARLSRLLGIAADDITGAPRIDFGDDTEQDANTD